MVLFRRGDFAIEKNDNKNLGLVNWIMFQLNEFKEQILTDFETEELDENILYKLKFKDNDDKIQIFKILAKSIIFLKNKGSLEGVFITVKVEDVIGKKLMEYEDWHTEELADTGNLSGPQKNLTLTFEDGYSIDIMGFQE